MIRRTIACAIAVALLCGCGHGGRRGRGGFGAAGGSPPAIPTAVARQATVHPVLTISGIIAPYQNVMLASDLTEPTDAVYVNEGDRVHRGEVLAQLDTADLEAELASDVANTSHTYYQGGLSISQGMDALRQARTTLRTDQLNLIRDETLLRQGYVARQVVDTQLETVRNDEQTLQSDESNVTANGTLNGNGLQASAVAQARAEAQQIRVAIAKATIYSPVDGTVVNRNLNPGEYPGSRTIFVVQQDNTVYAELNASSADVFQITKGSPVTLSIPGETTHAYSGRVVGVLGQVQPGSTNFTVKALIPSANGRLVAGLPVTGTIALAPTTGIGVPTTAFLDDSHTTLFIVNGSGAAQVAKVTEVASDGTTSIVTGVSAGTTVIANGQLGITVGQQITGTAPPSPGASPPAPGASPGSYTHRRRQ